MDVKERVKLNIYKELLKNEKRKNKRFKSSILGIFIFTAISLTSFNTINSISNTEVNTSASSEEQTYEYMPEDGYNLYNDFFKL